MMQRMNYESYPDFGLCLNHMQDITLVCKQASCKKNLSFCSKCVHHHPLQNSEQYLRELARSIINRVQPNQTAAIIRAFEFLEQISREIQAYLKQTFSILKGINLNKYKMYKYCLSNNQEQLYQQLCQLNIKQNGSQFESILSDLERLTIKDSQAPELLRQWVNSVQKSKNELINQVEELRDSLLELPQTLSFEGVIATMNESATISPISKLSVPQLILDLRQQSLVSESLVDRIKNSDFQKITHILANGNSLVSQGLKSLLQDNSINFTNLKKFDLSNNYLEDDCLDVLIESKNMPRLEELNLENNFIYSSSQTNNKIQTLKDQRKGLVIHI